MNASWVAAGSSIAAGIILGFVFSSFVSRSFLRKENSVVHQKLAVPLSKFILIVFFTVGLVAALGFIAPATLSSTPQGLINFIPKLISAGILLLGGYALSIILSLAASTAFDRLSGSDSSRIESLTKLLIMVPVFVMAATELGVNTTILNIFVTGIVFSIGISFSLLVGFGGRFVSEELAAGRALRSSLAPGAKVRIGHLEGVILSIEPTRFTLNLSSGNVMKVPYSTVIGEPIEMLT